MHIIAFCRFTLKSVRMANGFVLQTQFKHTGQIGISVGYVVISYTYDFILFGASQQRF